MKKSIVTIVSLVLLTMLASSYSSRAIDGIKGRIAPDFSIANADTTATLASMRGSYVLLNLWSSADADSRISNIRYDAYISQSNANLAYVAVNFDRNQEIYQEIIKRDEVNSSTQFYDETGKAGNTYAAYHLDEGYMSCLIDPAGEIVAINPSIDYLNGLFSE